MRKRGWAQVAGRIERFIRTAAREIGRDGAVVGLSGGLDSTTTARLCARALGPEKVLCMIMPERGGAAEVVGEAQQAAEWLGVRAEVVDVTPQLEALGIYHPVYSRIPSQTIRGVIMRVGYNLLCRRSPVRPFLRSLAKPTRLLARTGARLKTKHRVRMVTAYLRAESENLLLAGAANKTEKLTGLFCKFGIDHCADIMPIAGLYRSEVLELAAFLGVPEQILSKPPDPGIVPGASDKYRFFLGMDARTLDRLLELLTDGASAATAAQEIGVPLEQARLVERLIRASAHMRSPSMEPELPPCERA